MNLTMFMLLSFFAVLVLDHVYPFHEKVLPWELLIPEGEMLGQHPTLEHFRVPYSCLYLILYYCGSRSSGNGYSVTSAKRSYKGCQCNSGHMTTVAY